MIHPTPSHPLPYLIFLWFLQWHAFSLLCNHKLIALLNKALGCTPEEGWFAAPCLRSALISFLKNSMLIGRNPKRDGTSIKFDRGVVTYQWRKTCLSQRRLSNSRQANSSLVLPKDSAFQRALFTDGKESMRSSHALHEMWNSWLL